MEFFAVDIHLFLMAGLVALTCLGAAVCMGLLLLLAPALHLAFGRQLSARTERRHF